MSNGNREDLEKHLLITIAHELNNHARFFTTSQGAQRFRKGYTKEEIADWLTFEVARRAPELDANQSQDALLYLASKMFNIDVDTLSNEDASQNSRVIGNIANELGVNSDLILNLNAAAIDIQQDALTFPTEATLQRQEMAFYRALANEGYITPEMRNFLGRAASFSFEGSQRLAQEFGEFERGQTLEGLTGGGRRYGPEAERAFIDPDTGVSISSMELIQYVRGMTDRWEEIQTEIAPFTSGGETSSFEDTAVKYLQKQRELQPETATVLPINESVPRARELVRELERTRASEAVAGAPKFKLSNLLDEQEALAGIQEGQLEGEEFEIKAQEDSLTALKNDVESAMERFRSSEAAVGLSEIELGRRLREIALNRYSPEILNSVIKSAVAEARDTKFAETVDKLKSISDKEIQDIIRGLNYKITPERLEQVRRQIAHKAVTGDFTDSELRLLEKGDFQSILGNIIIPEGAQIQAEFEQDILEGAVDGLLNITVNQIKDQFIRRGITPTDERVNALRAEIAQKANSGNFTEEELQALQENDIDSVLEGIIFPDSEFDFLYQEESDLQNRQQAAESKRGRLRLLRDAGVDITGGTDEWRNFILDEAAKLWEQSIIANENVDPADIFGNILETHPHIFGPQGQQRFDPSAFPTPDMSIFDEFEKTAAGDTEGAVGTGLLSDFDETSDIVPLPGSIQGEADIVPLPGSIEGEANIVPLSGDNEDDTGSDIERSIPGVLGPGEGGRTLVSPQEFDPSSALGMDIPGSLTYGEIAEGAKSVAGRNPELLRFLLSSGEGGRLPVLLEEFHKLQQSGIDEQLHKSMYGIDPGSYINDVYQDAPSQVEDTSEGGVGGLSGYVGMQGITADDLAQIAVGEVNVKPQLKWLDFLKTKVQSEHRLFDSLRGSAPQRKGRNILVRSI
jgi:hypothetical protein